MSQKPRKAPFTAFERAFVKELVAEVAHVIESKKTDGDYNRKKTEYWRKITAKFNAQPQCQEATQEQLKKLWLNMKARARDAKSLEKQRNHTGGGAHIPDMGPEDDSVLSIIIPHIMPTVKVMDSDGKPDIDGDDDDRGWMPIKKRTRTLSTDKSLVICHTATTHTVTMHTATTHTATTHTATTHTDTPHDTTHTTSANTATCTTFTTATTPSATVKPKNLKNKQTSNIDLLKLELIQNNIDYHKNKYQQDLTSQKNNNDLQYQILLLELENKKLELEHKKRMFKWLEAEQEAKFDNTSWQQGSE